VLQLYRRTGLRSKQHRAEVREVSFLGHAWTLSVPPRPE
jgi:hypothetical protein